MYDIWFCPNYPIESIKFSLKTDRTDRVVLQAALAENIRLNGLVNPLIVLNHRGPKYCDHYVMQGLNRLSALKLLGWDTAPCIVTGDCEFEPKVSVSREDLQDYFLDGRLIWKTHGTWERPHMTEVVLPETLKYPTCKGVYQHEDYCTT